MVNLYKKLPFYNISRNLGRSIAILALIFALSFSLTMASYIGISMRNGLKSTEARLGADIVVMPVDAQGKFEGAILSGEPNSYYFNSNLEPIIQKIEGVKKTSPQVYIATLSASCCAFPVQIVGIDLETDFSITPWLRDSIQGLGNDEILAGANITTLPGEEVFFFDKEYKVKGKLDPTGMGFDNCVFMTLQEARELAKHAEEKGVVYPVEQDKLVSNIMINIEEGYEADKVSYEINKNIRGHGRSTATDEIVLSIGDQMRSSARYVGILLAIVWILCIIVLLIVFPLITRSRLGEFATLRVLGSTNRGISRILLIEIFTLSLIGSILGVVIGLLVSNLFAAAIKNALDMPFLSPNISTQLIFSLITVLICTILGSLSSLYTINKLKSKEIALVYSQEN